MSPKQCRAARALLDITQPDLATRSGLGLSTIVDFEKERRVVSDQAVTALTTALEESGAVFLEPGETAAGGYGVRLREHILTAP